MVHRIKISCPEDMPPINRQIPTGDKCNIGNCIFYINQEIEECDFWFIHHSVEREENTKCPRENVILITAEPSRIALYPQNFIKQFGKIFSCQQSLIRRGAIPAIPYSPWFAGAKLLSTNPWRWNKESTLKYDDFLNFSASDRENKIAVITSNKVFTRGHRKRLNFINILKSRLPDLVDIYGHGFMPIGDKMEVLSKYKYALVIENDSSVDYWTEKIADCFLSGCYPFYYGCKNIHDYFPANSMTYVQLSNVDRAVKLISDGLNNDIYNRCQEFVFQSRSLILDKYNVFSFITSYVNEFSYLENEKFEDVKIRPVNDFYRDVEFRLRNKVMRILDIEL